jgi:hypothetical protein
MAYEPRPPKVNASFPEKMVEADHKRFSVVMHNNRTTRRSMFGGNQNLKPGHYLISSFLRKLPHSGTGEFYSSVQREPGFNDHHYIVSSHPHFRPWSARLPENDRFLTRKTMPIDDPPNCPSV